MTHKQTINDLLAQLAACTTYAEYMPLRSRCVQALDSYDFGSGVDLNRADQWAEFERICAKVGPAIRAREYGAPVSQKQSEAA
jgi:hypothetical protein